MLSDYFGKRAKLKIFFLVLIPLLAVACILKMLEKRQPVDLDNDISIVQKDSNEGD